MKLEITDLRLSKDGVGGLGWHCTCQLGEEYLTVHAYVGGEGGTAQAFAEGGEWMEYEDFDWYGQEPSELEQCDRFATAQTRALSKAVEDLYTKAGVEDWWNWAYEAAFEAVEEFKKLF